MTVVTISPASSSGGASVDGVVGRGATPDAYNATVAAIAAGAGDVVGNTGPYIEVSIAVGEIQGSPNVGSLTRSIMTFDTSGIPSGATINSVTLKLWGMNKISELGTTEFCIVNATPASNGTLVAADYSQVGSTLLAPRMAYASFTLGAYNNFDFNSAGLAAINKGGITRMGTRMGFDLDGANPTTWGTALTTEMDAASADDFATAHPPQLVIDYTDSGPITITSLASMVLSAISSFFVESKPFGGRIQGALYVGQTHPYVAPTAITITTFATATFSKLVTAQISVVMSAAAQSSATMSAVSTIGQSAQSRGSTTMSGVSTVSFSLASRGSATMSGISTMGQSAQGCGSTTMDAISSVNFSTASRATTTLSGISTAGASAVGAGTVTMAATTNVMIPIVISQPAALATFSNPTTVSMSMQTAVASLTMSAISAMLWVAQSRGTVTMNAVSTLAMNLLSVAASVTLSSPATASWTVAKFASMTMSGISTIGQSTTTQGTVTFSALHTASMATGVSTAGATFSSLISAGYSPVSRGTFTASGISTMGWGGISVGTVNFSSLVSTSGSQQFTMLGSTTFSASQKAGQTQGVPSATLTLSAAQTAGETATQPAARVSMSALSGAGSSATSRGTFTASGITTVNFTTSVIPGTVVFSRINQAGWLAGASGSLTASGSARLELSVSTVADVFFYTTDWNVVAGVVIEPGDEHFIAGLPAAILVGAGAQKAKLVSTEFPTPTIQVVR